MANPTVKRPAATHRKGPVKPQGPAKHSAPSKTQAPKKQPAPAQPPASAPVKTEGALPRFHPRNRHQGRYDFPALVGVFPELQPYLLQTPRGETSIDFANPAGVKALNAALLALQYGIQEWDLPPGYLCPPVPGRADYVHHLADLLAQDLGGEVPRGPKIRVLDVGVGANGIYPLIGHREYGWSFLGTDIDPPAIAHLRRTLQANPGLAEAIELRLQGDPSRLFEGVVAPDERFAACLCNPPFHASRAEARAGTERKWRNLGYGGGQLNFGGQASELWCPGGEVGFLERLIAESAQRRELCLWFTALVSRSQSLPGLQKHLRRAGALEVRLLPMAQGQKQSRALAWTFLPAEARQAWLGRT